jgi:hypothetical protein
MKIITTLLLLLLASPVFAETYVCSYLHETGQIISDSYTRTANGFNKPLLHDPTETVEWDIVHEDGNLLVLHRTSSSTVGGSVGFMTQIAQIEKGYDNSYLNSWLVNGAFNQFHTGTCTVVE